MYEWTNDISYTYMMQSEWEKEMEKMKETKKERYIRLQLCSFKNVRRGETREKHKTKEKKEKIKEKKKQKKKRKV